MKKREVSEEWSFTQNVWTLKRFSHILEEVIMKMTDNDTQKSSIMSPKQHEMSLYK